MLLSFQRVLVTGGAGFIGSHLVDKLVKEGYEVVVLDNLSSGRLEHIAPLLREEKARFVRGDVRSLEDVNEVTKGVDVVCHLAASTSVSYSLEHPMEVHRANATGTLNMLKACLKGGVGRFVYVSSCAVYGEAEYLPVDEGHPTRPLSPYAASKLAAEHYCRAFREAYGLETVVLRLFNVYGPRQGDGEYNGVITRFLRRLDEEKPPIIYGDGTQTRDFVHVRDAVEAIVLALNDGDAGQVFNVGTGKAVSINRLARLLLQIKGGGLKPIYERPRVGDIRHSCADIRRARERLRYGPSISFERGLRELIDYLAQQVRW